MIRIRSSYQRCSVRIGVLKNFAKFTGKRLYQSLLFDKVADLRPATLLEKRFWHKCFPVNFEKFLITSYRIPLGDCFYRKSYEYSRQLFFQLNCENTRTMRKCGPKSSYEGIKLLIVNVELKQISRSLQILIFLLGQRKNCFDQNILSFHYFQCIKYGMLIPNKNVVRQSYQSLTFIKWHTVTLKEHWMEQTTKIQFSKQQKMHYWCLFLIIFQ